MSSETILFYFLFLCLQLLNYMFNYKKMPKKLQIFHFKLERKRKIIASKILRFVHNFNQTFQIFNVATDVSV